MILVTGATGRLGLTFTSLARQAGLPVRCLVRKGSSWYRLNPTGAEYRFGDLRDPGSLDRACQGVRFLVAASGLMGERRGNTHQEVTSGGHGSLWRAAARQGVEHAVFVSCLSVGRGRPTAGDQARREAEALLARSGLSHTVLRPAPFVEEVVRMARQASHSPFFLLPGAGRNRVSPLCLRDVALHALASLDLEGVRDRVVELGGPQTLTTREALDQALEALGQPSGQARLVTLPALPRGMGSAERQDREKAFREDLSVDTSTFAPLFRIPLTPWDQALRLAVEHPDPTSDPGDRLRMDERPAAPTSYRPGRVLLPPSRTE